MKNKSTIGFMSTGHPVLSLLFSLLLLTVVSLSPLAAQEEGESGKKGKPGTESQEKTDEETPGNSEETDGGSAGKEQYAKPLVTPQIVNAVENARAFLAEQQRTNGAIGSRYPVAVTSLACLALMAGGTTPGRGKYGDVLEKGLRYILSRSRGKFGFITERGKGQSRMHGHGYATLFLAEVYGTYPGGLSVSPRRLEKIIRRATRLIENSQSTHGGWYYQPNSSNRHEGSVTITQIQALRAVRNAGLKVKKSVIDKAVEYVKKSQSANGGFQYRLNSGRVSYALTAAAISTLNYLGFYEKLKGSQQQKDMADIIEKGLSYMENHTPEYGKRWYFYANFYAAQAYYFAGPSRWRPYYRRIAKELLKHQNSNGSWDDRRGPEYCTAFSLLILEIPYKLLPIFQK